MRDRLDNHPFFTRWEDPETGVANYVLTERRAPVQRGFYFQTPSISRDGKWLWFAAMFPPSRYGLAAAVCLDPASPDIRIFPQASLFGNPLVRAEGDGIYAAVHDSIYVLYLDGTMEPVFQMPEEILKRRRLFRLVTDMALSCDGKTLILDSVIGDKTLISLLDVASGRHTELRWLDRDLHHAQFSLHDPTLFMLGESPTHHPITGVKSPIDRRMWLMNTDGTLFEPLFEDLHFEKNCMSCHEWWTSDGKIQWCDYNDGIYETDVETRRRELIWPHPMIHGQQDPSCRFICGDHNPYTWWHDKPCGVFLYDRQCSRDIALATSLPYLCKAGWEKERFRGYHFDPHPHFSPDGRYVVYTGTVLGNMDVVLGSVESATERLA